MLQIFNELAWLVHVAILDEIKKIEFKAFVEQFFFLLLNNFFKKN